MTNTETRDTPTASSGAIKVIVVSAAAIIVLLVVIKQLDFTPSKVTTPTVSVEFQNKNGGIAPPTGDAPARSTDELEKKVRQLEEQLRASSSPNTQPGPATGAAVVQTGSAVVPPTISAAPVTLAGLWRSPMYNVQFTQVGSSVTMQVFAFGALSAVGQGAVSGNSVQVDYTNNAGLPGRMTGILSPDGSRIDAIDHGRGYPQQIVFVR